MNFSIHANRGWHKNNRVLYLGKKRFKLFLAMRLTAVLLFCCFFHVSANVFSQEINLTEKNAPLEKVMQKIRKQSGYAFIFDVAYLKMAKPVNVNLKNKSLAESLQIIFEQQPFDYQIKGKTIVLSPKNIVPIKPIIDQKLNINGKVVDDNGQVLAGASIKVKGTNLSTVTQNDGKFNLLNVPDNAIILVSYLGFESKEVAASQNMVITLLKSTSKLDEVQVIAYGTTTRRLNTSSVGTISSEQISTQPVTNVLAAMQGRIPGLIVTQSSGVSGSAFKVEVRGRTSLDASISGNDPLFIIDGVPFAAGNSYSNQIRSAANNPRLASDGGMSPLAYINPSDIESIEILKDADATAIYGSRGANGVILITTKKGKIGDLSIVADMSYGTSKINRFIDMLDTKQFIALRKEAFANDNMIPTVAIAPDIMLWDTTKYTNFQKLLIGNSAGLTNTRISLSGGNGQTKFLLSSGYKKETSVFPGDFSNETFSGHLGINHTTKDDKFQIAFQAQYNAGRNNLLSTDLTNYISLPPNLPDLKDSNGNLSWSNDGYDYTNPLAELLRVYNAENSNLSANALLTYQVIHNLKLKISGGYNLFRTDESSLHPLASFNPASGTLAFANFANSKAKSWILEPQIEYKNSIIKHNFLALLGGTWQQQENTSYYLDAQEYPSDLLLNSIAASQQLFGSNSYREYRYNAFFGRFGYNYDNKYLLNLSGRRDASSRFGPNNRIGNFWAIGTGWNFTKENWFGVNDVLSFGKIRMSYGVTGNDQVGDYRYLDNWRNTAVPYQGSIGLQPAQLYNPNYSWESNRKWETALELGFFKDMLNISTAYFVNRSSNRLINYTLPTQTGFASVLQNWNATVENSGLEVVISLKNNANSKVGWEIDLNITVPRNKLVAFPGLEQSSYKANYVVGHPLSIINAYEYLGVDKNTGIYKFKDVDANNLLTSLDYQILGNTDPKYYGGMHIGISYKKFRVDLLAEYRKQLGKNLLATQATGIPGYRMDNQSIYALDRWPHEKNNPLYQRTTMKAGSEAYLAAVISLANSNAIYSDASYIRGKNVSISYQFQPFAKLSEKTVAKIYFQGQNLFTITNYRGADPENQNLYRLPPLRTFAAGLQLTF